MSKTTKTPTPVFPSGESPEDRVDYLSEDRVRDILVRIVKSLAAGGKAMEISDILAESCLLTMEECRVVYEGSVYR